MGCSNSERSQKRFLILLYVLLFTTRWSSASERMTPEDEPYCTSRFDYEYKVIQKLVQLEERLKDVTKTINTQKETTSVQETEIKEMSDRLEESGRKLKLLEDARMKSTEKGPSQNLDHFQLFKNITGKHVGFTVKRPKDNTDPRLFETVIYNSKPGFNTATGKFLCHHPGMYLFTATIIRRNVTDEASCDIIINGSRKLRVFANNNNSIKGYPSGSGTLIIHLNAGDEVYLTGCSSTYMFQESSFSGVLIQPDIQ